MSAVDPASDPVVGLTRQLAESRQLPGSSSDVQTILSGVLRIADGLLVPAASVVTYWVWHGTLTLPTFYLTPTLLGAVLAVNFLHLFGAYTADALRRPALQLSKAAAGWMVTSATLVAIAYLTSTSIFYSRGWALLWLTFTLSGFVILRGVAAVRLREPAPEAGFPFAALLVHAVVHHAAKGIEGIDGVALVLGQDPEGVVEAGAALPRETGRGPLAHDGRESQRQARQARSSLPMRP